MGAFNQFSPAGTYQVQSNGTYTINFLGNTSGSDPAWSASGAFTSSTAGTFTSTNGNATITKVSNLAACQGNWSGTLTETSGGTASHSVSFTIDSNGVVTASTGYTVTSGKMFCESGVVSAFFKTTDTASYDQFQIVGALSGAGITGVFDSENNTGTVSLTKSSGTAATDVSGVWTASWMANTNKVMVDYLTFSQSGNILSGTTEFGGTLSGTISGSTVSFTNTYTDTSVWIISSNGTLDASTLSGTFSDYSGGTGSWSAKKGTLDNVDKMQLNYWPTATDKWWLSSQVYTQSASRVYLTGSYISGQYDLYKCNFTTSGSIDRWWSSNNAACTEGSNNYNVGSMPTLPFDITIHIVKASGEVTYTKTIKNYVTN